MKKIIIIFILWALIINTYAFIAANRYHLLPDTAYPWINSDTYHQEHTLEDFLNFRSRWDGNWYLTIAADGYSYKGPEQQSNVVFFPLYPFLIWLFSFVLFGNFLLSGWFVSMMALCYAIMFFYKLIKDFHPKIDPYLSIILLLIFPTAIFFNVVYTESLFLLLSIATFYYAFKKKFHWAGMLGLLAALTRVTGILLFVPILWEYLKENNFNIKKIISTKIIPIFLIPLGTLGFFLFHYLKFGDFLLFLKIESVWGRAFKFNWDHFNVYTYPSMINLFFDICFVIFAIVTSVYIFKRIRTSYALYILATLAVALSTGTLMSIGRYVLVLFPIFIFAASIKNEYFRYAWILGSILLLGMYTTLFVNGYWAG